MVADILSRPISDSRREKPTNDVKAKYNSIADALGKFNWGGDKDGKENLQKYNITSIWRALFSFNGGRYRSLD